MKVNKEFRNAILEAAKRLGCQDAELISKTMNHSEVLVAEEKIQSTTLAGSASFSLRVRYDDRIGVASTEVPEDPEQLVRMAIDNAKVSNKGKKAFFVGPQTYETVSQPQDPLKGISLEDQIRKSFELEALGLKESEQIEKSTHSIVVSAEWTSTLENTNGLVAEHSGQGSIVGLGLIAKRGEERRNAYDFVSGKHVNDFAGCAKRAATLACNKLGAASVKTGTWTIVLDGECMLNLIRVFSNWFNAQEVLEGKSPWKEKIGETVASPLFSLIDNPFDEEMPVVFDGEGMPARKTEIIKDGVLQTFLHNLSTAEEFGVETTANASRLSTGDVDIGASNLLVPAGTMEEDELMQVAPRLLWVRELMGLHSGVNAVSGDFSLGTSADLIENGQRVRAVDGITIAGNFSKLLESIRGMGKILRSPGYELTNRYRCPDIWISGLQVTGDADE